jgi:hypothetical protein
MAMIDSVPRGGVCCSIVTSPAFVIGVARDILAKDDKRTAMIAAVASHDLYLGMMIRINYLLLKFAWTEAHLSFEDQ